MFGFLRLLNRCLIGAIVLLGWQHCAYSAEDLSKEVGQYAIDRLNMADVSEASTSFALLQDKQGNVYIAGASDLMKFDGVRLQLVADTAGKSPRALQQHQDDRILIGFSSDFGYLEPDQNGVLRFHSLLSLLSEAQRRLVFGVTKIFVRPEGVYYRTARAIYFWANDKSLSVIKADEGIEFKYLYEAYGKLIVQFNTSSFYQLKDAKLTLMFDSSVMQNKKVKELLPFGEHFLAFTNSHGIYLFDSKQFKPWPLSQAAANIISNNNIYTAIRLQNGMLALAIYGDEEGLLLLEQDTQVHRFIRAKDGLSDNLVNFLMEDNQQGLWLATQNGVDRIILDKSLTYFDSAFGLSGEVYDIERHQGRLYAATSSGLFRLNNDTQPGRFEEVAGIYEPCSDIQSSEYGLLGACNSRLVNVDNETVSTLVQLNGIGFRILQQIDSEADNVRVLVGQNRGLSLLRYDGSNWHFDPLAEQQIDFGVDTVVIDEQQQLWALTLHKELKLIEFPDGLAFAPHIRSMGFDDGLPTNIDTIALIDGDLTITESGGMHRFDYAKGLFTSREDLSRWPIGEYKKIRQSGDFLSIKAVSQLPGEDIEHLVLVAQKQADGHYKPIQKAYERFTKKRPNFIHSEPSGISWVGTKGKLWRYDRKELRPKAFVVKPYISQLTELDKGQSLLNKGSELSLQYHQNSLRFVFAFPFYDDFAQNQFSYRLLGFDKGWSQWRSESRKDYTQISEGQYVLQLKAKNVYGEQISAVDFPITIAPPWQRTWWAYFIYALLIVVTVILLIQWRSNTLRMRQKVLKKIVNERTGQLRLSNEQLSRQADELRQATEAKSDFLAKMSHEIRTPMNAVIGLSQLALNTQSHSQRSEHIRTVLDSGKSLLGLINDILDFSKINAGQMSLENIEFSIDEVLTPTFNQCTLNAHEKLIELAVVIDASVPKTLVGDPLRLRQIFVNLLNNAIKFTDTGGVCLSAKCDSTSEGTLLLHCAVRDTGCGMSEQQQARLFQSYSQADDSISRTHGGTGLGLAIAKQLCELMDGKIWLESELQVGSTFHFSLVLQQAEQPESSNSAVSELSVLVIDEHQLSGEALTQQLAQFSISAVLVDNANEGVEQAKAASHKGQPFDLVLIDWAMADFSGVDVWSRVSSYINAYLLMVRRYDKERFVKFYGEQHQMTIIDKPILPKPLTNALRALANGSLLDQEQQQAAIKLPDLSEYHLLLVEDNAINRQVAMGFLGPTKATISIAENGCDAVHFVGENRYDLILMDIEMPKMDGIAATQIIRKELAIDDTPIIAMTAHARSADSQRFLKVGMNGHITKPFEPDELYRIIGSYLDYQWQSLVVQEQSTQSDEDPNEVILTLLQQEVSQLDVTRALSRLSGNRRLYVSMVKEFYRTEQAMLSKLMGLYKEGDWQRLYAFFHTLKSSAGFIGAFELSRLSENVEYCFKKGEYDLAQLQQLKTSLQGLIEALGDVLAKAQQPMLNQTFDLQLFCEQLHTVVNLLNDTDFAVEDLLETMKNQCQESEFLDGVNAMIDYVDDVEFELAAKQANDLLEKCQTG